MSTLSTLTKLLIVIAALLLFTYSYGQNGRGGGLANAPGQTGQPNNSNGKGPKPHGFVAGTNNYGNATLLTPTAFTSDQERLL